MPGLPLTDTHCHLDLMSGENLAVLAEKAPAAGVLTFFVPGVTLNSGTSDLSPVKIFTNPSIKIFSMLGVHPGYLQDFSETAFQRQAEIRQPFMIGEIGLDRRYEERFSGEYQASCFRGQLGTARELDIAVSLHIVGRHEKALRIIREFPGIRGIVHGFSGSPELARAYLRAGFLLGAGPLILNPACRKLRKTVSVIPPDCLVPETDAPFLFRYDGSRKIPAQPDLIPDIIKETARLQGKNYEDTAAAMIQAVNRLMPANTGHL